MIHRLNLLSLFFPHFDLYNCFDSLLTDIVYYLDFARYINYLVKDHYCLAQ